MKFQAKPGDIRSIKCDAVIVNLYEGAKAPSGETAAVDKALGNAISNLIKTGELKGKSNEIQVIHTLDKLPARLVLVAGLGKKEEFDIDKLRNTMGEAVRALRQHNCKSVATILHNVGEGAVNAAEVAEAMELVKRIRDKGITVIMIEHVMKAIMGICDRILVLHHGEKIAEGTPQEIATSKTVIEVYLGE